MGRTDAQAGAIGTPPSPRDVRRMLHKDLSRSQLLDAAEQVFGSKGFHDTTLKEIADMADFSVGSVYSFFESKEDLFRQIFARRGTEYMTRMRELLAQPASPMERLHHLVDLQVSFFREHPHFGRLYLRYSSATLPSGERLADQLILDNYDEALAAQSALFAEGQQAGVFCDGAPQALARMLSGLVAGFQAMDPVVMLDHAAGGTLPLDAFHELVARAFGRT